MLRGWQGIQTTPTRLSNFKETLISEVGWISEQAIQCGKITDAMQ